MNHNFLPALAHVLRTLGAYADREQVNDATLVDLVTDLDRAGRLLRSAQGRTPPANQCTTHPAGPVDPTTPNGCLLCGAQQRRPARQLPQGVELVDILQALADAGHEAATARFGPQAVTRALASRRHTSKPPDT